LELLCSARIIIIANEREEPQNWRQTALANCMVADVVTLATVVGLRTVRLPTDASSIQLVLSSSTAAAAARHRGLLLSLYFGTYIF
jgi:branched-subunit amino acid transport protein AzlD